MKETIKINKFKEENLKRIEMIKSLKQNWNDNNAEPIPTKVCENAINFINNCVLQPEVFPVARETIQCEYEDDFTYLEFEIFEEYIEVYISFEDETNNEDIHAKIDIDDYETINQLIEQYFKI